MNLSSADFWKIAGAVFVAELAVGIVKIAFGAAVVFGR